MRTGLDFLKKFYIAALEAGASEIVVVDTIEARGPETVEILVREVPQRVGADIPVPITGITTSAWPPLVRSPPCAAGQHGFRAGSTAWERARQRRYRRDCAGVA